MFAMSGKGLSFLMLHNHIYVRLCFQFLFSDDGSWFSKILSLFHKLDVKNLEMEHCPEMINVQRAVDTRGHLACYVALAMTKLGHR